jgi:hypothetical protein
MEEFRDVQRRGPAAGAPPKKPGRIDLDHTPIVFTGPTWISPMMMAIGPVAILSGVIVWLVAHLALPAVVMVAVGAWLFVVGVVIRKMPISLTITPERLDYVSLGVRRSWSWRDVDSFAATHVKSGKLISMREYTKSPTGRPFYLPGQWNAPRDQVLDLLRRAQDRWGRTS